MIPKENLKNYLRTKLHETSTIPPDYNDEDYKLGQRMPKWIRYPGYYGPGLTYYWDPITHQWVPWMQPTTPYRPWINEPQLPPAPPLTPPGPPGPPNQMIPGPGGNPGLPYHPVFNPQGYPTVRPSRTLNDK